VTGYTTREVASVLGLSPSEVRAFARAAHLSPRRGPRRELRFTFEDIVLLRAAKGLRDGKVPPRRIRRALTRLREQLPAGRSLSEVSIVAAGDHVVVRDQDTTWEPDTEQVAFDFSVGELASRARPFAREVAGRAPEEGLDADGWYDLGWDLEAVSLVEAREAYRRALLLRPEHAEARVNLGRLLHEDGETAAAEAEYRRALELSPRSAIAAFNLGVALEDLGRSHEARKAYERALELDPDLSSAHFNLAKLCEHAGDAQDALQHLSAYRRLTSSRT